MIVLLYRHEIKKYCALCFAIINVCTVPGRIQICNTRNIQSITVYNILSAVVYLLHVQYPGKCDLRRYLSQCAVLSLFFYPEATYSSAVVRVKSKNEVYFFFYKEYIRSLCCVHMYNRE